ncbi:MAG: HEAT repeat domain-containing protein, partial [Candidatus Eisenbacteria bacterium]
MTPSSQVPLPGLDLSPPLEIAVVLGCVAVGLYLVRAHQRRQHRHERQRLGWFMRQCQRLLRGEIRDTELDRDAAGTPEGEFWTALERLSMRWRRVDWLRLSRALENARWAATERRSLRDDSPWRQVLAARRLALLRSRVNGRALRAAMVRGPELTTYACAMALARYHDVAALRWLLQHPERVTHRPRLALQALLRGFGRRGRAELVASLDAGITERWVERAVIETLGLLRERAARPAVEQRLGSTDPELRVAAVRALGRMQAVESGTLLL